MTKYANRRPPGRFGRLLSLRDSGEQELHRHRATNSTRFQEKIGTVSLDEVHRNMHSTLTQCARDLKYSAMSFADLRSARKSRESKSFVTANQADVPGAATSNVASSTNSIKSEDGTTKTSAIVSQPAGLPASVEVRMSSVGGRGLHANASFDPGKLGQRSSCRCLSKVIF